MDVGNKVLEKMADDLLNEKWKPIEIYGKKTNFSVSSFGRVMNTRTGVISKQHESGQHKKKYLSVTIKFNGKSKRLSVHRLVANAFIPNPYNKPQVNHLDGNKKNNKVTNLEWATQEENMRHAIANGLMEPPGHGENARGVKNTAENAHKVCKLLEQGKGAREIAKLLNVTEAFIIGIKYNKNWNEIRSQYKIPESNLYGKRTPEQIKIIEKLVNNGIRNRKFILESAGLPYDNRNISFVKYKIDRCNHADKSSTTIEPVTET